jgi:uncharacterized protein Yka (UPF0111/DUF47 family)
MQELTDSIKSPNLRFMGIEEGEEVQAKGMCNIFKKIKTKISQIEHQTDLTKIELLQDILSLKQ